MDRTMFVLPVMQANLIKYMYIYLLNEVGENQFPIPVNKLLIRPTNHCE